MSRILSTLAPDCSASPLGLMSSATSFFLGLVTSFFPFGLGRFAGIRIDVPLYVDGREWDPEPKFRPFGEWPSGEQGNMMLQHGSGKQSYFDRRRRSGDLPAADSSVADRRPGASNLRNRRGSDGFAQ